MPKIRANAVLRLKKISRYGVSQDNLLALHKGYRLYFFYFRANDWSPILNTLRINKSLEFIGVRSFFQQPVDDGKERPGFLPEGVIHPPPPQIIPGGDITPSRLLSKLPLS